MDKVDQTGNVDRTDQIELWTRSRDKISRILHPPFCPVFVTSRIDPQDVVIPRSVGHGVMDGATGAKSMV